MKKSVIAFLLPLLANISCIKSTDDEGIGDFIRMRVEVDSENYAAYNISSLHPLHVMAYTRTKKCDEYRLLFEDEAFIRQGQLSWLHRDHEWPGT